jgi:hypothetical protein
MIMELQPTEHTFIRFIMLTAIKFGHYEVEPLPTWLSMQTELETVVRQQVYRELDAVLPFRYPATLRKVQ